MMNCFLDVNAVPEWIEKDGKLSQTLRDQATAKLEIMRQHPIDLAKLGEIDNQLRFVRLFCNYAKHLDPKPSAGIQNITMCSALPAEYPIRFDRLAVDGEIIYPSKLLGSVIEFWVQAEARYLQSSTSK